jgi:hypothetical protein
MPIPRLASQYRRILSHFLISSHVICHRWPLSYGMLVSSSSCQYRSLACSSPAEIPSIMHALALTFDERKAHPEIDHVPHHVISHLHHHPRSPGLLLTNFSPTPSRFPPSPQSDAHAPPTSPSAHSHSPPDSPSPPSPHDPPTQSSHQPYASR